MFDLPELDGAFPERRAELLGTFDMREDEQADVFGVLARLRAFTATFETMSNQVFLEWWLDFSAWCSTSLIKSEALTVLTEEWTPTFEARLSDTLQALLKVPAPLGPVEGSGSLKILTCIAAQGVDAFRIAEFLLRNVEPVFKAYAVKNAVRVLGRCAPQTLIRLMDAQYPSETLLSAANTPEGYVLCAWWDAALHVIVKRLRFQRDDALVSALLESQVPLLRALGLYSLIRAVAEPQFPRIAWPEALAILDRQVITDEHRTTVTQWLFELRRTVPQGGMEGGAEELRSMLYRRLISGVTSAVTEDELTLFLRGIGEPGSAPWVTVNSFVQPLISRGIVTPDVAAAAWLALIMPDIEAWAHNRDQGYPVRFQQNVHGAVTLVAAQAVLCSSPAFRQSWTVRLDKAVAAAERTVRKLWSRAINDQAWRHAWLGLMWAEVLLSYVDLEARREGVALDAKAQALLERLSTLTASAPTIEAPWPEDLARVRLALREQVHAGESPVP